MKIKIGTRGSRLALWQTNLVKSLLEKALPELETEIIVIKTIADRDPHSSIDQIGGKGVFIKEIEDALLTHKVDIAVHSLKDLASRPPDGLVYAGYLGGVSRKDVLLSLVKKRFRDMPSGARIACGSQRRIYQLKNLNPYCEFVPVRGNIDTRIRKLTEGKYDGLILAEAGLYRLGLTQHISQVFTPSEVVPAGGQGIICIETHRDNAEAIKLIKKISEPVLNIVSHIEFDFLFELQAGCRTPVGIHAIFEGLDIKVFSFIAVPENNFEFKKEFIFERKAIATISKSIADEVKAAYKKQTRKKLILS